MLLIIIGTLGSLVMVGYKGPSSNTSHSKREDRGVQENITKCHMGKGGVLKSAKKCHVLF